MPDLTDCGQITREHARECPREIGWLKGHGVPVHPNLQTGARWTRWNRMEPISSVGLVFDAAHERATGHNALGEQQGERNAAPIPGTVRPQPEAGQWWWQSSK